MPRSRPPAGPFTDAKCVTYHERESIDLVGDWKGGPHRASSCAPPAMATGTARGGDPQARQDDACLSCHGGASGLVDRSYLTSKHGIIVTMESPLWGGTRPLSGAAYRASSCVYCHLHQGRHGGADPKAACLDCHSPRFTGTMGAGGGMDPGNRRPEGQGGCGSGRIGSRLGGDTPLWSRNPSRLPAGQSGCLACRSGSWFARFPI